jgi:hypothetical protein
MPVSTSTSPASVSKSTAFTIGRRMSQVRGATSTISVFCFASATASSRRENMFCPTTWENAPPKAPPRRIAATSAGCSIRTRFRVRMSVFRATVSKAARFAREPSSEVARFALVPSSVSASSSPRNVKTTATTA